jgi:hypothetical protein
MFNQLIEDGELNFNPAANLGKLNKKKDRDAEDIDEVREENVYDMGQSPQPWTKPERKNRVIIRCSLLRFSAESVWESRSGCGPWMLISSRMSSV